MKAYNQPENQRADIILWLNRVWTNKVKSNEIYMSLPRMHQGNKHNLCLSFIFPSSSLSCGNFFYILTESQRRNDCPHVFFSSLFCLHFYLHTSIFHRRACSSMMKIIQSLSSPFFLLPVLTDSDFVKHLKNRLWCRHVGIWRQKHSTAFIMSCGSGGNLDILILLHNIFFQISSPLSPIWQAGVR